MANTWNSWSRDHYLGLYPWTWIQFESAELPGPFPFLGGVDPEVVASLQEAHHRMQSAIDTAISDVFAHRGPPDDPERRRRLEDAYAELVQSRPHLRAHIRCGRRPDGTFQWEYPLHPGKSATMSYVGLRAFKAATQQVFPFRFNGASAPALGKFLGLLDGTHTVAELQTAAEKSGSGNAGDLTQLLENFKAYDWLGAAPRSSIRAHWLSSTQDRDAIHLGHAALLYRQQDQFFLFDPWLMLWFAELPIPSLWESLLPLPAAFFLTDGVIDDLVKPYGPIATIFASQQQLQEVRTFAVHACLSPPGQWLEVGEDGFLTNSYLAQLATAAKARLFVSYATGGADWYPDHLSFMFSRRNPARTALLTAHWERPEALKDKLAPVGCGYHYSRALDIFRATPDGGMTVASAGEQLFPLTLYRLDHGDPPFMKKR